MSSIITMSSTVGELISGSTYRIRSRNAEIIIAAAHGTKLTTKGASANVLPNKTGK